MNLKTQRYLSLGLSMLNLVGVVGTFYMTTKEAPKAEIKMKSLPKDAKKITKIKTFVKSYKKSLIFAGAAIASGVGSKVLSAKTEASLLATIGMLDAGLYKYKDKIKKTLGVDADKDIIKEIISETYDKDSSIEPEVGEELFKNDLIGYFYAKPENIWKAMCRINDDISGEIDYFHSGQDIPKEYTLAEFIRLSGARPLSHTINATRLNFGWSYEYLVNMWDTVRVHWDCEGQADDDGARLLVFNETPIWSPEEWYMHHKGFISDVDYFKEAINEPRIVNMEDPIYNIDID